MYSAFPPDGEPDLFHGAFRRKPDEGDAEWVWGSSERGQDFGRPHVRPPPAASDASWGSLPCYRSGFLRYLTGLGDFAVACARTYGLGEDESRSKQKQFRPAFVFSLGLHAKVCGNHVLALHLLLIPQTVRRVTR